MDLLRTRDHRRRAGHAQAIGRTFGTRRSPQLPNDPDKDFQRLSARPGACGDPVADEPESAGYRAGSGPDLG